MVIIILIWIGSQLVVFPTLIGWGGHSYNAFLGYCVPDHLISPSYTLFFLSVGIFTPLMISTYSFIRIGYDVRIARQRVRAVSPRNPWATAGRKSLLKRVPSRINSNDARLVRSFLFITLYLFSAWGFLVVIMIFGDSKSFSATQITIAMTFAHTHCSMNGVLYAVTNKDFRQTYVRICRRICRRLFECCKCDTDSVINVDNIANERRSEEDTKKRQAGNVPNVITIT
ncbi:uncharacterized protein [Amphiura filiformis]|uniref:uncharacterized protein n=1 Tax=Amphiura filiformis TaxID=82378 RepID=UPI003B218B0D